MRKTKRKKSKKLKKFFIFVLIIFILLLINYIKKYNEYNILDIKYLASSQINVSLFNDLYEEQLTLNRGEKVYAYNREYIYNEEVYKKVIFDKKSYFVKLDNLVSFEKDIIKENVLYVRTPVTVYQDFTSSKILGYLPKGISVDIIGYDKITSGIVNMYKIKYQDKEGYIYGKYLSSTKEEALTMYNEDGIYDIHKDRTYSKELYGGKASNLDYYPYEKPKFDNNILLEDARTIYLNGSPKVLDRIDDYISLAKETKINAFVVDIKDGYLSYKSEIVKNYSMSSYDSANRSIEDYKNIIDKIKDNGFYVIGRIVAFNDSLFALDNKDEAIQKNNNPTNWISAYSRKAWEYNVMLAKEAVTLFNFNEIQFDYVRFPEEAYTMSIDKSYDFKNTYNEEKAVAIQNFLFYATDEIHKLNKYISVDVFGESANKYVTAYGQYWPAISNIVDVISAMPYPDHFNKYDYGFKDPVWTTPYELLIRWGSDAKERQQEIKTPALARTWIEVYDTIHEPKIVYDTNMVKKQIDALYDSGLINGYITWNAASSLDKYNSVKDAFNKEYR